MTCASISIYWAVRPNVHINRKRSMKGSHFVQYGVSAWLKNKCIRLTICQHVYFTVDSRIVLKTHEINKCNKTTKQTKRSINIQYVHVLKDYDTSIVALLGIIASGPFLYVVLGLEGRENQIINTLGHFKAGKSPFDAKNEKHKEETIPLTYITCWTILKNLSGFNILSISRKTFFFYHMRDYKNIGFNN